MWLYSQTAHPQFIDNLIGNAIAAMLQGIKLSKRDFMGYPLWRSREKRRGENHSATY